MLQSTLKRIRAINRKLGNYSYKHKLSFSLGAPVGIMVEPFSGCNYSCPLCPAGVGTLKRTKQKMLFSEFRSALGVLKYTTEYITLFNFGEPLMNEDLTKMVAYCKRYHIHSQLSTNGLLMTESLAKQLMQSGMDRIIFSLDTYSPSLYPRYRVGGDFQIVCENFKTCVELKRKYHYDTVLVAQYMIMMDNEDVTKMKAHGYSLGADEVLIKTIGIGTGVDHQRNTESFLPTDRQYQRYYNNSFVSVISSLNCEYVWKRMVLCSDGSCLPCCRDQRSDYVLGICNRRKSLLHIWNSKQYRQFRKRTVSDMPSISMCSRCPEALKYQLDPWVDAPHRLNCNDFKL